MSEEPTSRLRARLDLDLSSLEDGVREAGQRGGAIGAALGGAVGAAAGGILAGGAGKIADLFGEALGREASSDKLAAQLGLSPADQERAGKIAGDAFAGNYGDSLEQVNDSVASVVKNIGVSLSSPDFSGINAKVLDLASTFDQDLGGVTKAVGQLIRTGLAKDATEGLDIVTRGFQEGDDKADDFLDTLNEYGVQFQKLGLDGQTATGLISQGLKAGARDADLVADALKEFAIRSQTSLQTIADPSKVEAAQAAIRSAVQSTADAQTRANAQVASAQQAAASAEGTLTQALQTEHAAQLSVAAARQDALEQLKALAGQVEDAALSQRAAQLGVAQAQVDLDKTISDPKATSLQRQQAQLTYDQAVQQLKEQAAQTADLRAKKAAADRAGVNGSEQVRAAVQSVAEAHQAVQSAQARVDQAHAAQTKAQVDGQRAVAAAVEAVGKAEQNLATVQTPVLTATGQAFRDLGLDGAKLAEDIGRGGAPAAKALDLVLDRLRAVKDPVQQAQIATALFGTQAEDLGKALFRLDPSAAGLDKVTGAAAKLDKQIAGNSRANLNTFTRQLTNGVVTALELGVIPAVTGVTGALSTGLGPVIRTVTPLLVTTASVAGAVAGAFSTVTRTIPTPVLNALGVVLGVLAGLLAAQAAATYIAATANSAAAAATALFATTINAETGAVERGLVARTANNIATAASRGIALAGAAASAVLTGAQVALNAVLAANPIALVVIAIAALVAAFVVAYRKSETFRDVVHDAMTVASVAIRLPIIAVEETAEAIKAAFDGVVGFMGALPRRIGDAVTGLFDGVKNGFRAAINFIIDALNNLHIKIPEVKIPFGPKFGGQEFGFDIPRLAAGGVVRATSGGIPAVVGEGNYDELVQPLRPGVDTFGTDAIVQAVNGLREEVRKQNDRAFVLKRQGATA